MKLKSEKEQEIIRGVPDYRLSVLDDTQLIMLDIARFMEAYGCDDEALIADLYHRGRK